MFIGICCCILQFFASKKKRKEASSPHLKGGVVEKEVKTAVEVSPSVKGSLASYLVTSQDDKSPAKSLKTDCVSPVRQDLVKRKLALDDGLSAHNEECPSKEGQGFSGVDVVDRGCEKGASDSVYAVENPELKKFAADFLSLYCR